MTSPRKGAPSTWGWGTGVWGWGAGEDDPTGEVIERLSAEFAPLLDTDTVTAIVQQCRRDLNAAAPAPLPQASVMPTPRSHTARSMASAVPAVGAMNSTLTPPPARSNCGPSCARSTAHASSTRTTQWGLPMSAVALLPMS